MPSYRLSDEDRKRYGTAEWLDFSVLDISVADLEWLSERFDFEPNAWPTPFFGELTLEQAGVEGAEPVPPRWQRRALAWMLLRQNGHMVSWDEAGEVRSHRVQLRLDEAVAETPGKDASPPSTDSPPSVPSTTKRSRSSSTSRKPRSTS